MHACLMANQHIKTFCILCSRYTKHKEDKQCISKDQMRFKFRQLTLHEIWFSYIAKRVIDEGYKLRRKQEANIPLRAVHATKLRPVTCLSVFLWTPT